MQGLVQEFHSQGVLLLLSSPEQLQFGIDNITWKTGVKFKGLKLIPLGVHIIAYSLCGTNGIKTSQFIEFSPTKRIHVAKWDLFLEQFVELRGQQYECYCSGVNQYHFDAFLGAYPQQVTAFWKANTRLISVQVLQKLSPIVAQIGKIKEEESSSEDNDPKAESYCQTIYYSQIPRVLNHEPESISKVNLDRTPILLHVINKEIASHLSHASHAPHASQLCILGELQYSFIHFLIGESEVSFQQWKQLLILIVFSQQAFFDSSLQDLVSQFIAVLYEQLRQFPKDFFRDCLSENSFMADCLRRLKEYRLEPRISSKIDLRIKKLLEMVMRDFEFDLGMEAEEEGPVIVACQEVYF